MKRFLLATALLAAVCSIQAQAQEEVNTAPIFGIKVQADCNLPGKWHYDSGSVKMYRHGWGASVGGVCNIYLGRGFYLEPGVSLYFDKYSYYNLLATDDSGQIVQTDPSLHKFGIRIPVVVGYNIPVSQRFNLCVFTGPELNYAFAGDIDLNDMDKEGMPNSPFDYQRRVDCAWQIGIGVPARNFLFSITGSIGMTDLVKSEGVSFRENRLSVGLTYYF